MPPILAHALNAVRQTLEIAQRINQGAHRNIYCAAQRQCGQRVGRIVQSGHLQLAGIEQPLFTLLQPDFPVGMLYPEII